MNAVEAGLTYVGYESLIGLEGEYVDSSYVWYAETSRGMKEMLWQCDQTFR